MSKTQPATGDATPAGDKDGLRWPGKALRKHLANIESHAGMGAHRLIHCWRQQVGESFSAASVLRLAEVDEPLDAFWQVSAVVRELRFPRPNQLSENDELAKDLMLAVALSISDRLVRGRCHFAPDQGSAVVVPMADLLAASVVACSWLDVPLAIRHDTASGKARAISVIDDHPPFEFGTDEGSAQGVMRQELQAFLARHFVQGQLQPGISLQNLLAGLRHLKRSQGVVPVVAVKQGDDRHPLQQVSERTTFTRDVGVPIFEYGTSDRPKDMQELENDLLHHLQNSLQNLFLTHAQESNVTTRNKVFISYAHEDETWRETLRMALRPQERKGLLDVWDDKRLRTGDAWRKEIDTALATCSIAVLLVSMQFLNSDFINDAELTRIFDRHKREGLWIYPILIGPCDWEGEELLSAMQMKLCCGKAFKNAAQADQEESFAEIAREIRERLTAPAA